MSIQRLAVPVARGPRWIENFVDRHGPLDSPGPSDATAVVSGQTYVAADDSWFRFDSFFAEATTTPVSQGPEVPADWAVLIVRKGGFAVARLHGRTVVSSKVGRRHVQGRSKAGGQSQQRFARRRDNQARDAYRAAADYTALHTTSLSGPLVTAGDEAGLRETLLDPRLIRVSTLHRGGDVAEPRRDTLDAVVESLVSWQVQVFNAPSA